MSSTYRLVVLYRGSSSAVLGASEAGPGRGLR